MATSSKRHEDFNSSRFRSRGTEREAAAETNSDLCTAEQNVKKGGIA